MHECASAGCCVPVFPAICKFTGFSYPMRGKSLSFYRGKIQFNFYFPPTDMLNNNKSATKITWFQIYSIIFALNAIIKINDERYKSHKSRVGREEADKQMVVWAIKERSCKHVIELYVTMWKSWFLHCRIFKPNITLCKIWKRNVRCLWQYANATMRRTLTRQRIQQSSSS